MVEHDVFASFHYLGYECVWFDAVKYQTQLYFFWRHKLYVFIVYDYTRNYYMLHPDNYSANMHAIMLARGTRNCFFYTLESHPPSYEGRKLHTCIRTHCMPSCLRRWISSLHPTRRHNEARAHGISTVEFVAILHNKYTRLANRNTDGPVSARYKTVEPGGADVAVRRRSVLCLREQHSGGTRGALFALYNAAADTIRWAPVVSPSWRAAVFLRKYAGRYIHIMRLCRICSPHGWYSDVIFAPHVLLRWICEHIGLLMFNTRSIFIGMAWQKHSVLCWRKKTHTIIGEMLLRGSTRRMFHMD